jgi:hypothetical protein
MKLYRLVPAITHLLVLGTSFAQETAGNSAVNANLDRVVKALRGDAGEIRGELLEQESRRSKSKYYMARVVLHPDSVDECNVVMFGDSTSSYSSQSYTCWWFNKAVDPLRTVYTDLFRALDAKCTVEQHRDAKGSKLSGTCEPNIDLEVQFGKEKDGEYFIYLKLDRETSR